MLTQQPGAEQQVRDAVSAFGRAYARADTTALGALLTRDYVHVNGASGAVLHRDQWLVWVASRRKAMDAGTLVVDSYRVLDVDVRIYGGSAVVTGIAESRGREGPRTFASRVRFTNVWIKQDGSWRRAAFHDSAVP